MHIPDQMLTGAICPVTAVLAAGGVGAAVWAMRRSPEAPSPGRFAAVAALLFAGQMMNFPIDGGTSGHLLGGVLAAMLLGVPAGVLAMATVVTVQCLVFADGGVTVLGANLFNMAVVGAGLGGWCARHLTTPARDNNSASPQVTKALFSGVAAWISVQAAALAVSVELASCGAVPFATVAPAMLGTHALIGVGEAGVTFAAVLAFSASARAASGRAIWVPVAAAGIIALALSPFASPWPDGLEAVAERLAFLKDSEPLFVAPMAEYAMPYVTNEALATGLAGLAGVAVTFALAAGLAHATSRRAPC